MTHGVLSWILGGYFLFISWVFSIKITKILGIFEWNVVFRNKKYIFVDKWVKNYTVDFECFQWSDSRVNDLWKMLYVF